jgi:class 3 adenylate cyclase/tetratricopeptide (TPR) repeat protein
MSALRDWLRQNKFEQYADAFEANDIGLDILPDLTDRDLEQLGVSLGNRRRMLKAIAERGAGTAAPGLPEAQAPAEAERRQVTVLFSDMAGSTALSVKIDPELFGAVIRRYQDAVAGAVGRFGGFVAKFLGDGVLVYFGYPRAYEDAAERAVRAALAVMSETGDIELPDGSRLQTRIGIATGLVVVGEIVGTGSAQERTIVGETPNLAARLQALATPNSILISEATQNLLGGLFELEATGTHELKGFANPVPAWRVVGEAAVTTRFAAIRAGAHLPLVGRAHEMGLMLERWGLACHGEGQIVTLIGEGGIGKSRSVEALQEAIAGEQHTRIHLQCSPYHTDSALYPVIQHLSRAAAFAAGDAAADRLGKLHALFARRAATEPEAIALLAELLSIAPAPEGMATPAQRRAATISLLAGEIARLGETDPVLLVLEDAHWSDATTLELMTRLADSIGQTRLLVAVTARPDFKPPWLGRPHATLLTLGRLSRAECAQLITGVAAAHGLSPETITAIVGKTDGVPLFAEELTKSVVEAAGDSGAAVPATLKDSLMARLDRLGEARELAQIAAVVGRQFSMSVLEALFPRSSADLEAALAKLLAAEIVLPEGGGLERRFTFKHGLLRDAAYESLLLARRRDWHERTARVLERFPEFTANEPEVLAYHFGEAGLPDLACAYRMQAGDRAISRSALTEAAAHFTAGVKLAESLADPAERLPRQLEFLLKLGPALMATRGMQSAVVEETYRRAAEIGAATGDAASTFKAKWGLWLNVNLGRKTALARERANELVALAQQSNDGDLLLEAYHCRWSTAFFRGDVAAALADSRRGAEAYDMTRHSHLTHIYGGHDPGVCAHAIAGVSLALGDLRRDGAKSVARAVELGEALDHPNSLAHALWEFALFNQLIKNRENVLEASRRVVALAEKYGLAPYRTSAVLLFAWAEATTEAGLAKVAQTFDAEIDNVIAVGSVPQYFLGLGSETLLDAGRPADGLAYTDRALAAIDEPGVGYYLPEIYRLRGECLLALDRDNKEEARHAFATAHEIAQRQGAVIFERAALESIAKLAGRPPPV